MKQFTMKIRDKFINAIKTGVKKREYRLNDEKRQEITAGDVIVLTSTTNPSNYVRVMVVGRTNYPDWEQALAPHWKEDFKGIYSSVPEAVRDCHRFYSDEEVAKYGLVVFDIIPETLELKKSVVLLDTNIIIQRESHENVSFEVTKLYRWLDNLECKKMIHEATKEELSKYKESKVRDNMLLKLNAYELLNPANNPTQDFEDVVKKYPINDHSKIDNSLLLQAYSGAVDFLITNDREMLRKASDLRIRDHVLNVAEFLNKAETAFPRLIDYKMLRVKKVHFGDVDFNASFFDTLKEDYKPGFIPWFEKKRKENEEAYVFYEDNVLKGFLYIKVEDKNERYDDIVPPMPSKKRLKIGTFKIKSTGLRVGERFLKIIFDNATKQDVDEIYVTMFENKREEVLALRNLLEKWGFVRWGAKNKNESLFVKNMREYREDESPKFNYPLVKENPRYWFLPIEPEYHTDLFPDLILSTEDQTLYNEDKAHRYALEKVYVSGVRKVDARPGDFLLIYRKGNRWPKKYSSAVTGIVIFEEAIFPKTLEEYLKVCKNITIFSEQQLKEFYNRRQYRCIIKLIDYKGFDNVVILDELIKMGIVGPDSGPRQFDPISKYQYCNIIKKSKKQQ